MVIKRLEDIEREKAQEKREKLKADITEDINEVIDNVIKGPKNKNQPEGFFKKLLKLIGIIILLIAGINFILGNIWLLRFFIKDLF